MSGLRILTLITPPGNLYHRKWPAGRIFCIPQPTNMNRPAIFFLALLLFALPACRTARVATVWKTGSIAPITYNKIMVAVILAEKNDSLRRALEQEVAGELTALGYYSVSLVDEFGPYGLRSLNEEATYLSLCDNGIDAVLTLAQADNKIKPVLEKGGNSKHTAAFYYNRIWNYRNIPTPINNRSLAWESILFDLSTLTPQCVLQAGAVNISNKQAMGMLAGSIVAQLRKEKVITRQATPFTPLKPF
jgi:hypothetical protein